MIFALWLGAAGINNITTSYEDRHRFNLISGLFSLCGADYSVSRLERWKGVKKSHHDRLTNRRRHKLKDDDSGGPVILTAGRHFYASPGDNVKLPCKVS